MPLDVLLRHVSYAAGEVSPALAVRDDLARTNVAAARLENFSVALEGGLPRTAGTRYVLPLKDESERGRPLEFRYSGSDSYRLYINGGVARFYKDGGFLEASPGVLYEVAVPWTEADLDNLSWQQDGNRLFVVCDGYTPRYFTRHDHTDWDLDLYQPQGGPVDVQNLDLAKTIQAAAVSGTGIALVGVGTDFQAGDIGGVFRLDEPDLSQIPPWQTGELIESQTTPITGGTQISDHTSAHEKTGANSFYDGIDYAGSPQAVARCDFTIDALAEVRQLTLTLYAKNGAAPASGTDGTPLGRIKVTNSTSALTLGTIYSIDPTTLYRHWWFLMEQTGDAMTLRNVNGPAFKKWTVPPHNQRRYLGRVYEALADGSAGVVPPTHEDGDAPSGYLAMSWRFLYFSYGFVRITAVADATHATGDVIKRLPDTVVSKPTYRWFPPGWSPRAGWPKTIAMDDGRLVFARDEWWWRSRASDIFSVEQLADATDPDSALSERLRPRGKSLPHIQWINATSVLMFGTRDNEIGVRPPSQFDTLTAANARPVPLTAEGSAPHRPADVDEGLIFIGRSRDRLHFIKFDNLNAAAAAEEISIANRRLLKGRAAGLAFARDPDRQLYARCEDGTLAGYTFMPAQQVLGAYRRPFAGIVEDVSVLPTADEGRSDVTFIVQRTINGTTRRYVEQLVAPFAPADEDAPDASGAWFVDCGLHYSGAPVSTVSGAVHLRGATVAVFADGCQQSDKVVSPTGAVTLDFAASEVTIGLPLVAFFRSLPFEVTTAQSSSKGKQKLVHHVVIDVVESAGGEVRVRTLRPGKPPENGPWEPLLVTGDVDYGAPIPLYTGAIRVLVGGSAGLQVQIEVRAAHALPFTLAGVSPELTVTP